jgi:hypothetical protein
MAISKHALSTYLPLVPTVNQTVDLLIIDWQIAALQALTFFNPSKEDDSNGQWWVAFGKAT